MGQSVRRCLRFVADERKRSIIRNSSVRVNSGLNGRIRRREMVSMGGGALGLIKQEESSYVLAM